ncbi:MAG: LPS export ABC transporter permease LptF [Desulfobacterium sp.]|jgi:lipopolysaccharide export system permease protein|nr:LPS export ABC transporter permease LptF [Desulfobacterium sp.]
MTTINRYIFRELIPPFAISSVFLTSIFLMTKIPEITNMVVNYNTGVVSLLLLISYTLPRFMEFTIPMSVMISVLLTFMRMSTDNEIIALKGGGVTIYRLLPPVLIFCLMGTLLTLWVTLFGVPQSKLLFKTTGIAIARSNLNLALSDRKFNSSFKDVMIYVSAMDVKTKTLKDLFIEDRRTKDRVTISVAPEGVLARGTKSGSYTLRLYGGSVNQVDLKTKSVNNVAFDTYDINLDFDGLPARSASAPVEIDEMSLTALLEVIKKGSGDDNKILLNTARMALHEKFSLPAACMALGLLAMALGLQSASNRKSQGFGLALFCFILYYLLLAAGWSAGESGVYPPALGMWLPNVVLGGGGVYLLVQIANERPMVMPRFLSGALFAVKKRLTPPGGGSI